MYSQGCFTTKKQLKGMMKVMSNQSGKKPAKLGAPTQFWFPSGTHPAPFCKTGLETVLDRAKQLESNPTLLAEDAESYTDKTYVQRVSELFWAITKTTEIPVLQIKKFYLSNMEKAFSKLAKEQRDEYKELCKFWGIVPEEHRAKAPTKGVRPYRHLNRLTHWGYFDLYFPNLNDFVELVVQKTYTNSTTMSKLDMAKYAQIFALIINGHCLMPYDLDKFNETHAKLQAQGKTFDPFDLKETVLATIISGEKNACWNAGMLYHFYTNYMKQLPDGAINLDAVIYFMELIDYNHKLLIKEFMDMLSEEMHDGCSEKTEFKSLHLSPIMANVDIRALKEELFPLGVWDTNITLFMTNIPEKERRAYRYAYNRFEKNKFAFGEGVETVKTPFDCRHPLSRKQYTMYGYRYAWSPLAVRVSDPNELWMMRNM